MRKVVFISRCSGESIEETRRVLDLYAQRIGDFAWSASITEDGLEAVRTGLLRNATKATAVACHVIRDGRLALSFIVGRRIKFGKDGSCSISTSSRGHAMLKIRLPWEAMPLMRQIVSVASLWHDIGKSSIWNQGKLDHGKHDPDPIRHELLSALLYQRMEGSSSVIEAFRQINTLYSDTKPDFPYDQTPETIAELVGWLITTHHRSPKLENGDLTAEEYLNVPCTEGDYKKSLHAKYDLLTDPLISEKISREFNKDVSLPPGLAYGMFAWLRLSLMVGDHSASAAIPDFYNEPVVPLYAKSRPAKAGEARHSLSWHTTMVEERAKIALRELPRCSQHLPGVWAEDRVELERVSHGEHYQWQNVAARVVSDVMALPDSVARGKFVVLGAQTGSGKTRMGARIASLMSGDGPMRLTTLLGLRTLTLQTADAYKKECGFSNVNMACLIGSREVKALHDGDDDDVKIDILSQVSFEIPPVFAADTETTDKKKLLGAPVLVCTTDYLASAADWRRAKHVLPQLRIASSDILIDEVDGYDLEDLCTIGRLCYVVGLFGRRLILSTATAMPEIIDPMMEAYLAGWKAFAGLSGAQKSVDAMFISDKLQVTTAVSTMEDFNPQYESWCHKTAGIIAKSAERNQIHRGKILDIEDVGDILKAAKELHQQNFIESNGCRVSAGLVRFAHVQDVVHVGLELAEIASLQQDVAIKVLMYHANLPLAVRAWVEKKLDEALKRGHKPSEPDPFLASFFCKQAMSLATEMRVEDAMVIVVASPVEEVGRDHDFDWGILEPSSTRSLIQLIGRINRHRRKVLGEDRYNIVVMNRNCAEMQKDRKYVFTRPGFELGGEIGYPPFTNHECREIAPRVVATPHNGHVLVKQDDLPQWEGKRIEEYFQSKFSPFIDEDRFKFSQYHYTKFRAGQDQVVLYYDLVEDGWKEKGDTEVSRPTPRTFLPISQSYKTLMVTDEMLQDIAIEISAKVGLQADDEEFSKRYMAVTIDKYLVDKQEDALASPVFGITRIKPSILCKKRIL
jgi:CRISPR-associated endonuclease/helicase Cas3